LAFIPGLIVTLKTLFSSHVPELIGILEHFNWGDRGKGTVHT